MVLKDWMIATRSRPSKRNHVQTGTFGSRFEIGRSSFMRIAGIAGLCIVLALAVQRHVGAEKTENAKAPSSQSTPKFADEQPTYTADEHEHWAYQPIKWSSVPSIAPETAFTPVDAFVIRRLNSESLSLNRGADRRTLIRRLSFDLTGLPPTPDMIERFVANPAPDAYERLVDQLLADPRYGERWGQHWLDVVRFAESEGFEYDRHLLGAWRFRDFVIASFNDDQPFDRFVAEQLAGDELASKAGVGPSERNRLLVAAGFHRLGAVRRNAGNPDVAFSRNEVLTEMTDIVGAAFLGLTVGCARCHDHMYDAIRQQDYYQLQAFFGSAHERRTGFSRRTGRMATAGSSRSDGDRSHQDKACDGNRCSRTKTHVGLGLRARSSSRSAARDHDRGG